MAAAEREPSPSAVLFDFDDLELRQPCQDLVLDADAKGVARGHCMVCSRSICQAWVSRRLLQSKNGLDTCNECGCKAECHLDLTSWLQSLYERQMEVLTGKSYAREGSGRLKGGDVPMEEDDIDAFHIGHGFRVRNPLHAGIPVVAWTTWTHIEARLLVHSGGVFHPGRRRALEASDEEMRKDPALMLECTWGEQAKRAALDPDSVLVSVICPTTSRRRPFHPCLYQCFLRQKHQRKELVVVDSGEEPSSFFEELAKSDPRVVYHHFKMLDDQWVVGLKRNIACYLAKGQVVIHFDDDDLYGPGYISSTVKAVLRAALRAPSLADFGISDDDDDQQAHLMRSSRLPPAAATMAAWHLLDLSNGTFGYLDAENDPEVEGCRDGWVYGWGFSFAYTKSAWCLAPFAEVTHCEDYEFMCELRRQHVPIELLREEPGGAGLCAHTHHPLNTSGGEFIARSQCGKKVDPPTDLTALLPKFVQAVPELEKRVGGLDDISYLRGLAWKSRNSGAGSIVGDKKKTVPQRTMVI